MIGISFPFDRYDEFAELLPRMAESGVRRIELQELNHSHLPNDVFRVTACLRKLGMDVIYHTAEASPQNALKPLARVLSNMEKGRILLITAPPLSSISAVRGLAEYVRENHLPITVASVCDERSSEEDLADYLSAADAFATDALSLCLDIRHMDAESGLAVLSNKHLRSRISHIRATEIGEEMDNSRKNLLTEAGFGYF